MNETRKSAEQSLLETGMLVLFRVVDTHTEVSPDKENVFVRAELALEGDDQETEPAEIVEWIAFGFFLSDMSAKALAQELDVPPNRVTVILHGQRGVTADTALRLSRYLGTSPEFWLNLQKTFELRIVEMEAGESIAKRIKPRPEAA